MVSRVVRKPIILMTRTQETTPHAQTWMQAIPGHTRPQLERGKTLRTGCVMPVPTTFLGGLGLKPEAPPHPGWGLPLRKEAEAGKKMELARETEEGHALHPAQTSALGNGWQAGLVPSTAS